MGNYNNELNQIHFILDTTKKEKVKEELYNIFRHDCDFTENVEFFREDTISLGYKDEADRLINDYLFGKKIKSLKSVEKIVENLCSEIFENDSFYSDYAYDVIQINDTMFSVSISYTI
jgi:hypothetical protein